MLKNFAGKKLSNLVVSCVKRKETAKKIQDEERKKKNLHKKREY
jgi:hypothetical protein